MIKSAVSYSRELKIVCLPIKNIFFEFYSNKDYSYFSNWINNKFDVKFVVHLFLSRFEIFIPLHIFRIFPSFSIYSWTTKERVQNRFKIEEKAHSWFYNIKYWIFYSPIHLSLNITVRPILFIYHYLYLFYLSCSVLMLI